MNAIIGGKRDRCPAYVFCKGCFYCTCAYLSVTEKCENDIRRYRSWATVTNWCNSNWNAYINRRWHNTCRSMPTQKCIQ